MQALMQTGGLQLPNARPLGTVHAMTTPGQRLQAAIKDSGKSQRRIALSVNIAPQAITNAIRRDQVSPALAQAVAEATGTRWEWILTGQEPKSAFSDMTAGARPLSQAGRRLPVFSLSLVTSWPPRTGVTGTMFAYVDAELGALLGDAAFCLSIDDDSMRDTSADSVQRGDRVIIDPAVQPRPGDLVLAILPGQPHALLRRYRDRGVDADGRRRADLVPLNPDYATLSMALDDPAAVLCGVMMEHRRQRRTPAE